MDTLLNKSSTNDQVPDIGASELDYYRILRGQIEHEDNLVGSRISWFVTSQSFLFSAYAIMSSGLPANPTPAYLAGKRALLVVAPIVGITTGLLILLAILSGVVAMTNLRRLYTEHAGRIPAGLPPIQGSAWTRMTGIAAPVLLPILFMAVWVFLLLRRLI
jgi:hypothetical protein